MKKILIVYTSMVTGGSTTSLLSILNNLDYSKYGVDLLLRQNSGDLYNKIPDKVNVLPQAIPNPKLLKVKKACSPVCVYNFIKSRFLAKKHNNFNVSQQITAYDNAKYTREIHEEYDIAISFLELWSTYYVANFIKAKRKIGWIHIDYNEVGFLPELDKNHFDKLDKIVLVSKTCRESFVRAFPRLDRKAITVENILAQGLIRALSLNKLSDNFKMDSHKLNISTVCRIVFSPKGLDRGVEAFRKLKEENLCNDVVWYIIGDGPDYNKLDNLIKSNGLENYIILVGKKSNPHQYIKDSDLFFLPSRYEGKPMAVTEAMMLGIPPIVAEYASAREQINDGVDGLVFKNDDNSIYEGLRMLLKDRKIINTLKSEVNSNDYSNLYEMQKIIKLLESS